MVLAQKYYSDTGSYMLIYMGSVPLYWPFSGAQSICGAEPSSSDVQPARLPGGLLVRLPAPSPRPSPATGHSLYLLKLFSTKSTINVQNYQEIYSILQFCFYLQNFSLEGLPYFFSVAIYCFEGKCNPWLPGEKNVSKNLIVEHSVTSYNSAFAVRNRTNLKYYQSPTLLKKDQSDTRRALQGNAVESQPMAKLIR